MTLTTNRESNKKIDSPKKLIWDVNPKDFTREKTRTITPTNTEFDFIDKSKNFYVTDSKMQKQFNYDYHHWGANKKVTKNINKNARKARRPFSSLKDARRLPIT